jgi:hypothetical protein
MLIGRRQGEGRYKGRPPSIAAAPYTSRKLNASDVTVRHSVSNRSDAQLSAEIEALRLKMERPDRR